jgi:hypothetical protein
MSAAREATSAPRTDAAGPRVILPPGWVLLPVSSDNAETARETFAAGWKRGPRDSVGPFIHRMESWLTTLLDDAHRSGGTSVVLPLGVPWQVPVSTGIVFSRAAAVGDVRPVPLPDAGELVQTDAGPARHRVIDHDHPSGADTEALVMLHTIERTWVAPEGDAYLLATASIAGQPIAEYGPVADALVLLIETMLDAVTWSDDDTAR